MPHSQLLYSALRGAAEFALLWVFLHGLQLRRGRPLALCCYGFCMALNGCAEMFLPEYSVLKLLFTYGLILLLTKLCYRVEWKYMLFCITVFLLNRGFCMAFGFAAAYEAFGIPSFSWSITRNGHFLNRVRVPVQMCLRLLAILFVKRRLKLESHRELSGQALLTLLIPMLCNYVVMRILGDYIDGQGENPAFALVYALLLMSLCSLFLPIVADSFFQSLRNRELLQNMQRQSQEQYGEFMRYARNSAEMKALRHDMKNYMCLLREMGDAGAYRRTAERIEALLSGAEDTVKTGNATLDLLLSQKSRACRDRHIELLPIADFSQGGFMDPMDICTIFGNAVDNAMEAICRLGEGEERTIELRCMARERYIVIRIKNPMRGRLRMEGERLLTTKAHGERHGIGVENIRAAAGRYGGTVKILVQDGYFTLNILIPIGGSLPRDGKKGPSNEKSINP